MAFIGLQPLTADSRLPQFMRSSLSLYESVTNARIPCDIVSSRISKDFTIPSEPVDSNILVSDTIIYRPVSISLELYVYEEYTKEFFKLMNDIQKGNNGFTFIDRKETIYSDLYMTSISYNESADQLGSFLCSIELQQVMKVSTVKSIKTLPIPAAEVSNKGNVPAKKVEPPDRRSMGKRIMQDVFKVDNAGQAVKKIGTGISEGIADFIKG